VTASRFPTVRRCGQTASLLRGLFPNPGRRWGMGPGRSPIPSQPVWGANNLVGTPGEGLPRSRAWRPSAMGGVSWSCPAARRATPVSSMAESTSNSFLPPGLVGPRRPFPVVIRKRTGTTTGTRTGTRTGSRLFFRTRPGTGSPAGGELGQNLGQEPGHARPCVREGARTGPNLHNYRHNYRHDGRTRYWTERRAVPAGRRRPRDAVPDTRTQDGVPDTRTLGAVPDTRTPSPRPSP